MAHRSSPLVSAQTGLCAGNGSRLSPEQKCWMLATRCELHGPSVTPGHASGCLTLAWGEEWIFHGKGKIDSKSV